MPFLEGRQRHDNRSPPASKILDSIRYLTVIRDHFINGVVDAGERWGDV